MKHKDIERRINIHFFIFVFIIIVFLLLDTFNVYTLPDIIVILFLILYPVYIVLSTIYLIDKNYNIDHDKLKKIHSWNHRGELKKKFDEIERQMKEEDMKKK